MNEVFARKHLCCGYFRDALSSNIILPFAVFLFHSQDVQLTVSLNTSQFVDPQSFASQKFIRRDDFLLGVPWLGDERLFWNGSKSDG